MGRHVFWRSSQSTGHAGGLRAGMQVHVAGRGGGVYLGMSMLHTWGGSAVQSLQSWLARRVVADVAACAGVQASSVGHERQYDRVCNGTSKPDRGDVNLVKNTGGVMIDRVCD